MTGSSATQQRIEKPQEVISFEAAKEVGTLCLLILPFCLSGLSLCLLVLFFCLLVLPFCLLALFSCLCVCLLGSSLLRLLEEYAQCSSCLAVCLVNARCLILLQLMEFLRSKHPTMAQVLEVVLGDIGTTKHPCFFINVLCLHVCVCVCVCVCVLLCSIA